MKFKTILKIKHPTFHFSIERWKYNIEYDVWVSTHGRLKDGDGNIIKQKVGPNGYMLYNGAHVHRLVMSTWKPVKDYGHLTVDHLNHNKRENTLWNLEWVTAEENQRRAEEDKYDENKSIIDKTIINAKDAKVLRIKIDGIEKTIANLEDIFKEMSEMKDITKRGYLSKAIDIATQDKHSSMTIGNHIISNY